MNILSFLNSSFCVPIEVEGFINEYIDISSIGWDSLKLDMELGEHGDFASCFILFSTEDFDKEDVHFVDNLMVSVYKFVKDIDLESMWNMVTDWRVGEFMDLHEITFVKSPKPSIRTIYFGQEDFINLQSNIDYEFHCNNDGNFLIQISQSFTRDKHEHFPDFIFK